MPKENAQETIGVKLDNVEETIGEKLDNVKETIGVKLDNVQETIGVKLDNLLTKIEDVFVGYVDRDNNNDSGHKIKFPPCSSCYEELKPNHKIAQCINGHFLCYSCFEKTSAQIDCGQCGLPVNNRAFGMETFMKSLAVFDQKNDTMIID